MAGREKSAFELAVGAISRRERTVAEVRAWLAEREVDEGEATDAVEHLIEIGQLDDERYAEMFTHDKRELSGWGPDRIRADLIERGVAPAIAEAAVAGEDRDDLAERAATLLAKRGQGVEDDAGRRRALAFLARRGFELEVAYDAVRLAGRRAA